jgi:hypothetical protein
MFNKYKIKIEFVPQDFWIGIFWKKQLDRFDLYLCLIPMFPIHFTKFLK